MEKCASYITVYKLLKGIGCREDLYTLNKLYVAHPLPHSIRSISDLLDESNIDNKVIRLSMNQLYTLKKPVIVMLCGVSESFYVLYPKDVGQPQMCLAGSKRKPLLLTEEQFVKYWNGITLVAEVTEERRNEPLFEFLIKQSIWLVEQHLFFVLASLIICLSCCLNSISVSKDMGILGSMIIKGAGVVLSVIAVFPIMKRQKSYGNICMGPCHLREEVLVFNWVSLSEISLSYFVSTFMIGLIFGRNVSFLFLLLSCICMGFLIYSLTYQAINARWCLNCILIDCIIIADFIANIYHCDVNTTGFWLNFAAFCLTYLIILLAIHNFIEFLDLNKRLDETKYRKERLLENEQLVVRSITNGVLFPKYDSNLAISNGMDSGHKVTLIIGLKCPYCRELFYRIVGIQDCRLDILLFSSGGPNTNDILSILQIFKDSGWTDTITAIDNYYKNNKVQNITVEEDTVKTGYALNRYYQTNKIDRVPLVLIDGHLMPDFYGAEDLSIVISTI